MTTLFLLFFSIVSISTVQAQDAVSLSANRFAQEGYGTPKLTIHGHTTGTIQVQLRCGGRSYDERASIQPGSELTLDLVGLSVGQHKCSGSLELQTPDGARAQMPLNLSVGLLSPLALTVAAEDLDLDNHTLRVRANRPLQHVQVEVIGPDGSVIGTGETSVDNMDGADLQWSQTSGEAVKLRVSARDSHALPGQLELSPWFYSIPHEDIVFQSGQSTVVTSETPKLEEAWQDIQNVLAKYGKVVTINLYIAGYTDTVGPAGQNRVLSLARAKSIAGWFKHRGFSGAIHYQGFGESVLAITTADETAEAANRRAVYLLAAQKPARSELVPTDQWIRLH